MGEDTDKTGPNDEKPHYIDYDSGWGTPEELEQWEKEQEDEWRLTKKLIGRLINAMSLNSFLYIQYGPSTTGHQGPYARATRAPDGVKCEIVPAEGLSPHQWRPNAHWLTDNGWGAPDTDCPNCTK